MPGENLVGRVRRSMANYYERRRNGGSTRSSSPRARRPAEVLPDGEPVPANSVFETWYSSATTNAVHSPPRRGFPSELFPPVSKEDNEFAKVPGITTNNPTTLAEESRLNWNAIARAESERLERHRRAINTGILEVNGTTLEAANQALQSSDRLCIDELELHNTRGIVASQGTGMQGIQSEPIRQARDGAGGAGGENGGVGDWGHQTGGRITGNFESLATIPRVTNVSWGNPSSPDFNFYRNTVSSNGRIESPIEEPPENTPKQELQNYWQKNQEHLL